MSVTASNLLMGPATLYYAPFGSTEPAGAELTTAPASPWVDLGGTNGGLTMTVNLTYTNLVVDQVVDNLGSRLTARDIQVATSLAEYTLDNLKIALNGGTITTGASGAPDEFDPGNAVSTTQPEYGALIFDGWAPADADGNSMRRRVVVRKVLSTASVGTAYAKDQQTLLPVTFDAFYVSSSVAPFHIFDQTA